MAKDVKEELNNINGNVEIGSNIKSNGNNISAIKVDIDYSEMANAFLLALNSSEVTGRIEKILNKILEKSNKQIVLNTGELIGATADAYDAALANNQTRGERGN